MRCITSGLQAATLLPSTKVRNILFFFCMMRSHEAEFFFFCAEFYLILDLAAGGTSGWFPDGIGNKPWFDKSSTAMRDFALAQDTWHGTWATDVNDLAFRV